MYITENFSVWIAPTKQKQPWPLESHVICKREMQWKKKTSSTQKNSQYNTSYPGLKFLNQNNMHALHSSILNLVFESVLAQGEASVSQGMT